MSNPYCIEHPDVRKWAREELENCPIPRYGSPERYLAKQSIANTLEEIAMLSKQVAKQQAILSPIRRLPEEILAKILALHLNSMPYTPHSMLIGRESVLEVCEFWKQVARNNPFCWNEINIVLDLHFITRATREEMYISDLAMDQISSQIALAGSLAIDFTIGCGSMSNVDHAPHVEMAQPLAQRLDNFFEEHAKRFRTFAECMGIAARAVPRLSPDLLTHLRFTNLRVRPQDPLQFPALVVLFIDGTEQPSEILGKLLCPNVRKLFLSQRCRFRAGSTTIHAMLRDLPLLEELTVGSEAITHPPGPKHPNMKRIRLHGKYRPAVLQAEIGNIHEDTFQFLILFLNCFPNLTGVIYDDARIPERPGRTTSSQDIYERVRFLRFERPSEKRFIHPFEGTFPKTTHVQVGCPSPGSVFEWQAPSPPDAPLKELFALMCEAPSSRIPVKWPHLEHLELTNLVLTREVVDSLLKALQSRWLSRLSDKNSQVTRCHLSLNGCYFVDTIGENSGRRCRRRIGRFDLLSWPDACKVFEV